MSFDISSVYNNYISTTGNTSSSVNNLNRTLKSDMTEASDEKLMSACKEFEAYFYEQVFKQMRKAMVPGEGDPNAGGAYSTLTDYYKDNLVAEYSKSAADQSKNGIAQMLYEQMKRNYGI